MFRGQRFLHLDFFLDAQTDYVNFQACSAKIAGHCSYGVASGLYGATLYDLPVGPIDISFQTCWYLSDNLATRCNPLETTYYNNQTAASPALRNSVKRSRYVASNIRKTVLEVRKQIQSFVKQEKLRKAPSNLFWY